MYHPAHALHRPLSRCSSNARRSTLRPHVLATPRGRPARFELRCEAVVLGLEGGQRVRVIVIAVRLAVPPAPARHESAPSNTGLRAYRAFSVTAATQGRGSFLHMGMQLHARACERTQGPAPEVTRLTHSASQSSPSHQGLPQRRHGMRGQKTPRPRGPKLLYTPGLANLPGWAQGRGQTHDAHAVLYAPAWILHTRCS
jgi:hypothetical protein